MAYHCESTLLEPFLFFLEHAYSVFLKGKIYSNLDEVLIYGLMKVVGHSSIWGGKWEAEFVKMLVVFSNKIYWYALKLV